MQKEKSEQGMARFHPDIHQPATPEDREKIIKALWEGWELMVDLQTGKVWIGKREELIAEVFIEVREGKSL